MQVGKGQGQHHHHQAGQRVEHLAPELDLVALRRLAVVLEVADVLEQVDGGHAIGLEHGSGHHVGGDGGGPQELRRFFLGDVGVGGVLARKNAATGFQQHPSVIHKAGAGCVDLRCHASLIVKLEHAHALHAAVGDDRAHVDRIGAVTLALLEPGASGTGTQAPLGAGLDELRCLVAQGGEVVADRKCDQHKTETQGQQGAQRAAWAQAAGAHDGEFRTLCQPRHDKDRPDQHRDGQQFVQMTGNAQSHRQHGERNVVARCRAAVDPAQFIHQVEKEEQRQKPEGHEGHGTDHLAVYQFADGSHALALRCQSCAGLQWLWRTASTSAASAKVPPCSRAM
jgi:hypothetical protein